MDRNDSQNFCNTSRKNGKHFDSPEKSAPNFLPNSDGIGKKRLLGIGERTQDIYNAAELSEILEKTVITRTFEELTGKEIRRIHQVPVEFAPEEKAVYVEVIKEFHQIGQREIKPLYEEPEY